MQQLYKAVNSPMEINRQKYVKERCAAQKLFYNKFTYRIEDILLILAL